MIVDYDPLPAVIDLDDALAPGAPLLFEELGSNVCGGNRGNAGDPLDDAEVVVRGRFVNQRVAVVPMEGGACAVVPGDDGLGHNVVHAPRMPDAAHDEDARRRHHRRRDGQAPGDRAARRRVVRRQALQRRGVDHGDGSRAS